MKDDLLTAVDKFTLAMTKLAASMTSANLGRLFTVQTLLARRDRWGGMRADARSFPDEWQSSVCAGLICSVMPCPSEAHRLECHHSCHGGGR